MVVFKDLESYCITTRKILQTFSHNFSLPYGMKERSRFIFMSSIFFSANFGIGDLKGSFLPSEHSSRNYLPNCPAHSSAQKRLPYVRNEKKSSLKKIMLQSQSNSIEFRAFALHAQPTWVQPLLHMISPAQPGLNTECRVRSKP